MRTNKIQQRKFNFRKGGFTLLFASLISALVLSIGLAILNITLKQMSLSMAGRESQQAFYSADAGTECALYLRQGARIPDCQGSEGGVYVSQMDFGVANEHCEDDDNGVPVADYENLECYGQKIGIYYEPLLSGAVNNIFGVNTADASGSNKDICFTVEVIKEEGSTALTIESRGVNVCGDNGKYERAIRSSNQ